MNPERAAALYRAVANISPLGDALKNFEAIVVDEGVPDACRYFFQKAGAHIAVNWDNKTESQAVLEKESFVIIGNHPHLVEPFALTYALPSRKDIFAFASPEANRFFAKDVRQYILPIKRGRSDEVYQHNQECIQSSISLLRHGHAIVIFPNPGPMESRWRTGIGKIVDGALGDNVYYVMSHIDGARKSDVSRVVMGMIFKRKALSLSVRIASPIKTTDLPIGKDVLDLPYKERVKGINQILESQYRDWIKT